MLLIVTNLFFRNKPTQVGASSTLAAEKKMQLLYVIEKESVCMFRCVKILEVMSRPLHLNLFSNAQILSTYSHKSISKMKIVNSTLSIPPPPNKKKDRA